MKWAPPFHAITPMFYIDSVSMSFGVSFLQSQKCLISSPSVVRQFSCQIKISFCLFVATQTTATINNNNNNKSNLLTAWYRTYFYTFKTRQKLHWNLRHVVSAVKSDESSITNGSVRLREHKLKHEKDWLWPTCA